MENNFISIEDIDTKEVEEIYQNEKIKKYANHHKQFNIYKGVGTDKLLEAIPEIKNFFDYRQSKYNRRRSKKDRQNGKQGRISNSKVKRYVCILINNFL